MGNNSNNREEDEETDKIRNKNINIRTPRPEFMVAAFQLFTAVFSLFCLLLAAVATLLREIYAESIAPSEYWVMVAVNMSKKI